ncbi:hypothetical protein D0499_05455 [Weissella soli]|uniref:hypothetical protein n=1 Tax=Weissella soli TaxID=155866 RepID=UPI0021C24E27|nr:hypothetical protein [Weissella soli]MCT8395256.1 hypothetical protein [Weissella soli]
MNNIHYTFVSGYADSEVKIVKKGVGISTPSIDSKKTSAFKKRVHNATRAKEQRMRTAYKMAEQGFTRDEIAEKLGVTTLVVGKYINAMKHKKALAMA